MSEKIIQYVIIITSIAFFPYSGLAKCSNKEIKLSKGLGKKFSKLPIKLVFSVDRKLASEPIIVDTNGKNTNEDADKNTDVDTDKNTDENTDEGIDAETAKAFNEMESKDKVFSQKMTIMIGSNEFFYGPVGPELEAFKRSKSWCYHDEIEIGSKAKSCIEGKDGEIIDEVRARTVKNYNSRVKTESYLILRNSDRKYPFLSISKISTSGKKQIIQVEKVKSFTKSVTYQYSIASNETAKKSKCGIKKRKIKTPELFSSALLY